MAQTNVQAFSGDVAISSNLAVDTNTLFVDSVGNKVGIGNTSPATYLHLSAKNSDPGASEGDGIGTHTLTEYLRFTSTADSGDINSVSVGFKLGADDNSTATPDGRLDICANEGAGAGNTYGTVPDKTIATFLGSGNVGIGTTSPDAELHVAGTGAIVLPGGTTGERPGTGVAGMVRFNATTSKLEYHTGSEWLGIGGVSAIGGVITTADGYTIHTFTSSGTLTVLSGGEVEYLVVAGGGGGSNTFYSGGGGAGGMLTGSIPNVTPGDYTVTIGAGGTNGTNGTNGSNSLFDTVIATGGGGGATHSTNGFNGGSGGGGGYDGTNNGEGLGSVGGTASPSGQGNNGGRGNGVGGYGWGGGGGGAGGAGVAAKAPITNQPGHGGVGAQSSITGTATYYAGGAGGRLDRLGHYANGGTGGGGNGTQGTSNGDGTAGGANTGGGGGPSKSGGSGIVIIRYLS